MTITVAASKDARMPDMRIVPDIMAKAPLMSSQFVLSQPD
eukprot:CAMPEP_0119003854 /NCGR_PEP_ID=MMETSP1176-20130426/803_1 /TAXON_ID=265551 /ORGANISM="Synedropsis recta cf, Strain CCMP1620" /LENGTH=39 /DNA_ID= /DNA_START= /DNA_END= /DNA_ORIENTATION=